MPIKALPAALCAQVALQVAAAPPPPSAWPKHAVEAPGAQVRSRRLAMDWRNVQAADLIIRAEVVRAAEAGDGKESGFLTRPVRVLEVFKGAGFLQPSATGAKGQVLVLRGVPSEGPWQELRRLQGREAILWLGTEVEEVSRPGWYLANASAPAVLPYHPDLAAALRTELGGEDALAASVRSHLQSMACPHEAQVRKLIDRILDPRSYGKAGERKPGSEPRSLSYPEPMAEFERLGAEAIPAIVKVMDDRRALPRGRVYVGLDIRQRPGAFEGLYHTTAGQVVDFLSRALEQLTLDEVGTVIAESPNWRRDAVVKGWLLYLGHSEKWSKVIGMRGGAASTQPR